MQIFRNRKIWHENLDFGPFETSEALAAKSLFPGVSELVKWAVAGLLGAPWFSWHLGPAVSWVSMIGLVPEGQLFSMGRVGPGDRGEAVGVVFELSG